MRPATHDHSLSAVRSGALFASALQCSEQPGASQVRQAVAAAIRTFGQRGCAERVAQEFGDHPETAVTRMRWARKLAAEAFSNPATKPPGARLPASRPRLAPSAPGELWRAPRRTAPAGSPAARQT
jgi:hypothetical protein